jgi:hypothetical protein
MSFGARSLSGRDRVGALMQRRAIGSLPCSLLSRSSFECQCLLRPQSVGVAGPGKPRHGFADMQLIFDRGLDLSEGQLGQVRRSVSFEFVLGFLCIEECGDEVS